LVVHNIRAFAFVILGLAFGTYVVIFLLTQDLSSIDFSKALFHISTTISINIIFWLVFIKWLWKLKLFYPWLVQVPNLSGKWEGTIKSNWGDGALDPIPMEIAIVGQFSSGKSTFLNALLSKNILPVGITPVTSKVNFLNYGKEYKQLS